eukprot:CAMPEP_0197467842 /NCGR_PEP_ID=MMETSP1175-20131217/65775_1 /TAXON_ID=1003142 /ORGANISM="Triceratium dubium, Strain CCMP147" /LENGTH=326 /DNA_ID=CAMNT_0043003925 /DNA_START=357 /DNA_END=1336 /DNA_ORIENTATION=+
MFGSAFPAARYPVRTVVSSASVRIAFSGRQTGSTLRRMHPNGGPSQAEYSVPLWPPFTVQDRPSFEPVYNGVNPNYPGLRVLSSDPPIFAVDDFLTRAECDFLVRAASDSLQTAPVVGKGAGQVSQARTSSTCFLAREDLPEYIAKVSALTGKQPRQCELPQVGRYLQTQQYMPHFDAFDLTGKQPRQCELPQVGRYLQTQQYMPPFDLGTDDGRRVAEKGGQRTVTVLVYLNDVERGGQTSFPALGLDVQPKRGMAVVFFPATVDGYLDRRVLHAALPAEDVKYVSQVWIRQGDHDGMPSKRLGQDYRKAAPAIWDAPQLAGRSR